MKKVFQTILLTGALFTATINVQAQAFEKGVTLVSLGIGGADMYHIPGNYSNGGSYDPFTLSYNYNTKTPFSTVSGQFSVQAEWGIHKYVGLGLTTGFGGGTGLGYGWAYYGSSYNAEFNIPIGVIANFHFYQLIADKVGKDIHADKLDVYAGLNLGTGVSIHPSGSTSDGSVPIDALIFGGPQVGARYYFTPKIAANLELGFGKTFVNGGITFKLGGSSKK